MGVRKLTSWLKTERERIGPLWWLRVAIPVAVLVVILFWVMLVFMNEGFWMGREAASLPVVDHQRIVDRGIRPVRLVIDQSGRLSIADNDLTAQELTRILTFLKTQKGDGYPIPVEIRAEAKTAWRSVQPVLGIMRRVGYSRVSFMTRDENGWPSFVGARVDSLRSGTPCLTITRDRAKMTSQGKPCTAEELRNVVNDMSRLDRAYPVCLVSGPTSSVQDVVEVISMVERTGMTVRLAEDAPAQTAVRVQPAPGTQP